MSTSLGGVTQDLGTNLRWRGGNGLSALHLPGIWLDWRTDSWVSIGHLIWTPIMAAEHWQPRLQGHLYLVVQWSYWYPEYHLSTSRGFAVAVV